MAMANRGEEGPLRAEADDVPPLVLREESGIPERVLAGQALPRLERQQLIVEHGLRLVLP